MDEGRSCCIVLFGGRYWCVRRLLLEIRFTYDRRDGQFLIFVFILGEFGFYVLIRQIVNAKEWLSACRTPFIIHFP
jgi:hypothetical protein